MKVDWSEVDGPDAVAGRYPDAAPVELELRGKSAPARAYVVDVAALPAPAAA